MSRQERVRRDDDSENIRKAYDLLFNFIQKNQQIEGSIWMSAIWNFLMGMYLNSGFSHDEVVEDVERMILYYKGFWKNDN